MSTAVATPEETPVGEVPAFDPKSFMEARNKGAEPPKVEAKPDVKAAEPVKAVEPEPSQPKLPRSVRRELNRLREELGAAKALAGMAAEKPEMKADEDAEPTRAQFHTDAEYLRATQKWDRVQEAKQRTAEAATGTQSEQERTHLKAMDDKAAADIALMPDWDAVSKAATEDEDAPELVPAEHPTLMGLLATSDVRAFALYHFAKHPAELEAMLELSKSPGAQIRAFAKLEGKLEKVYSDSKAAQATDPEAGKKDRKNLAEADPEKAKPGETAGGANPPKPKPSAEVAARGGSPAPDEPAIGSPAWMLKRNQVQYGH